MILRTLWLLLLTLNLLSLSVPAQADENWDKEFNENFPENTPPKKPGPLSKFSVHSYDQVIEEFRKRRMRFGILAGGFMGTQGANQHVNINNLVGDDFSVSNRNAGGGIFGVTYYLQSTALENDEFELYYGLSAFYLPHTTVVGYTAQENLFTNLKYKYQIYNIPTYFGVKLGKIIQDSRLRPTFDLGFGINKVTTAAYYELSITPYSVPNVIFHGASTLAFSVETGVGLKLDRVLGKSPVECGYRFLYLGEGKLVPNVPPVTQNLSTGNNFANVIACEVVIG